jgi:glucose 1-dehydrogenase
MVEALAEERAKVGVNFVLYPEAADGLVGSILDVGGDALAIETDITDAGAVKTMFERIDKARGGIDILINNAGTDGHAAHGLECDPDRWSKVININLKGTSHCARQASQRMVAQTAGLILNASSVHELIAWTV